MGKKVYANGNEIACKTGDGKVIAAFPDVCMSPPSPPAGPIPIPYPNSSFSRDLKKGSKSVKINGKPLDLKGQSFYKTSPLGNEAATKSFGAGLVTHQTTGKTYFGAGSMDVKVEGKSVCRHIDLTTSNHGSDPGNCAPGLNLSTMQRAAIAADKCPCCGGDEHGSGLKMSADEWYEHRAERQGPLKERPTQKQRERYKKQVAKGKNPKPLPAYRPAQSVEDQKQAVRELLQRARSRPNCSCKGDPKPKVLPEAPCNIFYEIPDDQEEYAARKDAVDALWEGDGTLGIEPFQVAYKEQHSIPKGVQVNHLVPRSAGGCPGRPGKEGNLQRHDHLCDECQQTDKDFSDFQTVNDSMFGS